MIEEQLINKQIIDQIKINNLMIQKFAFSIDDLMRRNEILGRINQINETLSSAEQFTHKELVVAWDVSMMSVLSYMEFQDDLLGEISTEG